MNLLFFGSPGRPDYRPGVRGLALGRVEVAEPGRLDGLEPVDLQAFHEVAEVVGVGDDAVLGELRSEGDRRRMAEDAVVNRRGAVRGLRDLVARVDREAIDDADAAVPHDGGAVAGERGVLQVGLLDHPAEDGREDEPALRLGHVLLVQGRAHVDDVVEDVGLVDRDEGAGGPEGESAGLLAGGVALVVGIGVGIDGGQDCGVNRDLHLLAGVVGPLLDVIDVRLELLDVVDGDGVILALVDEEVHLAGKRPLAHELLADGVIPDGDVGDGTDVDRVAVLLDFPFIIRVADRGEHSRRIELHERLARPNLGSIGPGMGGKTRRYGVSHGWSPFSWLPSDKVLTGPGAVSATPAHARQTRVYPWILPCALAAMMSRSVFFISSVTFPLAAALESSA